MKDGRSLCQQTIQYLDGIQRFLAMGMLRLSVGTGQVRVRVDNRISSKMMHVRKGYTPYIVTQKEYYHQVFEYRITQILHHSPGIFGTNIFISFHTCGINPLRFYYISDKNEVSRQA